MGDRWRRGRGGGVEGSGGRVCSACHQPPKTTLCRCPPLRTSNTKCCCSAAATENLHFLFQADVQFLWRRSVAASGPREVEQSQQGSSQCPLDRPDARQRLPGRHLHGCSPLLHPVSHFLAHLILVLNMSWVTMWLNQLIIMCKMVST